MGGRAGDPARAAEVRQRLLDLALDASTYLRQHQSRAVRVSAALLLATSLAACSPSAPATSGAPTVEALTQEVRQGLPSAPGRYLLDTTTLARDEQGVYQFRWRDPASLAGQWSPASASLMRLAPSQRDELEVPTQGDPILHLTSETPIGLVPAAGPQVGPTPQPGASGSSTSSSSYSSSGSAVRWYPFDAGSTATTSAPAARAPAYYDPPRQATIAQGAVRGSIVSTTAPPPSSRTSGLLRSAGAPTGGAAAAKSGVAGGASSPASGSFSQGSSRPGGSFRSGG